MDGNLAAERFMTKDHFHHIESLAEEWLTIQRLAEDHNMRIEQIIRCGDNTEFYEFAKALVNLGKVNDKLYRS